MDGSTAFASLHQFAGIFCLGSTWRHCCCMGSQRDAVEGFFAKLTNRRLKRGVFHSIVALQAAISRFVKEANHNPKPFQWTKDPGQSSPRSGAAQGS